MTKEDWINETEQCLMDLFNDGLLELVGPEGKALVLENPSLDFYKASTAVVQMTLKGKEISDTIGFAEYFRRKELN